MMYIATAAKEALRPYSGQSIEIDAQDVFQPVNPGDGTIRKFAVLGPSVHLGGGRAEDLPIIQGLTLKAGLIAGRKIPNLTMEIRNAGNASVTVNAGALGYAVFGKKMPTTADYWVYPSDGSSTAYITRVSVVNDEMRHEIQSSNGTHYLYLARIEPEDRVQAIAPLKPRESVKTAVSVILPAGEYQFLAGYGCGVHSDPCLPSNAVSFDIDQEGKARLIENP